VDSVPYLCIGDFAKPNFNLIHMKVIDQFQLGSISIVDAIMDYEDGQLDEAGILKLFSLLIQDGSAWTLQGHYGRTARALIDAEYISEDGKYIFFQDIVQ